MTETPYIIQVTERGQQRLCLGDGTPIPAQIESTVYQDVEQARKGICTFSVLVAAEDEVGANCSNVIRPINDGWAFEMPDGRICEVENYIRRQTQHGTNAVQLVVTAKMIQTVEVGGICNTVNIGADANHA